MTLTLQRRFRQLHSLRVRWAEVDPQGIVFNGNYLTYADVGITEYLRGRRGFPGPGSGWRGILCRQNAAELSGPGAL